MSKVLQLGSKERNNMAAVAAVLTAVSPKGREYSVGETWEDYGAGMKWTTIHYPSDGYFVQILSPRQWEMVAECESPADIMAAVEDLRNDDWFSDK